MPRGQDDTHAHEGNKQGTPASKREHGETVAVESRRERQTRAAEKLRRKQRVWDGQPVVALAPRTSGLAQAWTTGPLASACPGKRHQTAPDSAFLNSNFSPACGLQGMLAGAVEPNAKSG